MPSDNGTNMRLRTRGVNGNTSVDRSAGISKESAVLPTSAGKVRGSAWQLGIADAVTAVPLGPGVAVAWDTVPRGSGGVACRAPDGDGRAMRRGLGVLGSGTRLRDAIVSRLVAKAIPRKAVGVTLAGKGRISRRERDRASHVARYNGITLARFRPVASRR